MKIKFILQLIILLIFIGCTKKESTVIESKNNKNVSETGAEITFIELGSVKCIPCRQMQPVMESIEKKFNGKVKVIFYDVWKDNKPAKQYGIQLIPTQVFLDKDGNEFYRHEGFFAEEEIIKLFETKGVKPVNY